MLEKELYDFQVKNQNKIKLMTKSEFDDWFDEEAKNFEGDKRTKQHKEFLTHARTSTWLFYRRARNEYLREKLHQKQKHCDSDIAAIKIISKDGNQILLTTGSDGTNTYAILDNCEDIPCYYEGLPIVLHGTYKIMAHDCSKSFEDAGEIISNHYIQIYRAGKSYIFLISK